MAITDLLERNSKLYGSEVALVEINPEISEQQRVTWKEYELIRPTGSTYYRREITWKVFDEKANRFANLLLERGVKKGDKVEGTVTRITPFGAFVQISPAVEALVHVSELGEGSDVDPEKVFTLNERKTFKVLDIDKEGRKISLSIAK